MSGSECSLHSNIKLQQLPHKPGVYRFLNIDRKIIYVGKARDLKKRITSYFQENLSDKKTAILMQHVVHLEIAVTADEDQALLLECHLIKKYHPKYNILMRDDKSYPYLLLSAHNFPQLDYCRSKSESRSGGERKKYQSYPMSLSNKARYFGPYSNAGSVRENLALIQKLFKLRQCRDGFFKSRSRPCLQYQINRCTAPCVNYVSKENYRAQVNNAILFLEGKNKEMLRSVKTQMNVASHHQDYETAAQWRDVLCRLKKLQISRRVASVAASRDWISISIIAAEFRSHESAKNNMRMKLALLQKKLNLPRVPERIECFDISHTMGEAAKASCVVFGVEGAIKKLYRQFNIENITLNDDYAAMQQVLTRRYTKLKTDNKKLPDLIMVDGGKGQLKIAATVLESLQLNDVMLMGIAKGVARKPGLEKIFIWGRTSEISLSSDDPVLHLLQLIRDEAHRFAITAHRKKRDKNRFQSILDTITGVGKKRKMDLLKHFGGLQELKKASVETISTVKGISDVLAKTIYTVLHEP